MGMAGTGWVLDMDVFEVETKFRVSEKQLQNITTKLIADGGTKTQSVSQEDTYYDHPSRDFAETDEALRIRHQYRTSDTDRNAESHAELTYKGPKLDKKSKTRVELSVSVDDRERAESLLLALGFELVGTVCKERDCYQLGSVQVTLDRVHTLGVFVELETITEDESQIEQKRDLLLGLAEDLGLHAEDSIRLSYLELMTIRES
ncbi:class IV adenylate cyclase [Candidatus Thorarchaeota archaeon]|nr:MAG: class IV adenylate cyclase [Candidatus Thorarchaeota archaeon]